MRATVEVVHKNLWDPFLGGVWRHDCYLVDNGDAMPWAGCTIWLAECYLAMGEKDKAKDVFNWVVEHLTCCGLAAESYFTHDMALVLAMPSYSQGGIAQMLHHNPEILK